MSNVNAFIGTFVALLLAVSTTVAKGDDPPAATNQSLGAVTAEGEAANHSTARIPSRSSVTQATPGNYNCHKGEAASTDRFGWLCTINNGGAEGGEATYVVRGASGDPIGNVIEVSANYSHALVDLDLHGRKVQVKVQPDSISFPSPSLGNSRLYFESFDCTDEPWIEADFIERFGSSWQSSFEYDGISYYQVWDEVSETFSYYEVTPTGASSQEVMVQAMSLPGDVNSKCYPYPHAIKRDAYKFIASSILDGVTAPFTLEARY